MGNCITCVCPNDPDLDHSSHRHSCQHQTKPKTTTTTTTTNNIKHRKQNPYATAASAVPIRVLNDVPPSHHRARISDKYILGRELGWGEFDVTYLCTDLETKQALACKSISKKKLRTTVHIEDVCRELTIMARLPDHPDVVRLKENSALKAIDFGLSIFFKPDMIF